MNAWRWISWYPVSRKPAEEHLAGLEKSYTTLLRPDLPLKALIVLTHKRGVELTGEQLRRIAACLAQEQVTSWAYGWSDGDEDSALTSLLFYRKLITDAGPRAVEAMRWLLEQPPTGAGPAMPLPGTRSRDNLRPRARIPMAREWPLRGAKLIAIELLAEHDDGTALPACLAIVADHREDWWTRCEAGLAALGWVGATVAEEVAYGCVDMVVDRQHHTDWFPAYARRLARSGPMLVPFMMAHLRGPHEDRRLAAAALLKAVGEPAVPALTELIETSDNLEAMEQAAVILAQVAPAEFRKHTHRLAAARERYEVLGRGLSRAEPPGADAERGLSRPEE